VDNGVKQSETNHLH